MNGAVFITGITGFVGKHLQTSLNFEKFKKVYLLVRDPSHLHLDPGIRNAVIVKGDLDSSGSYLESLNGIETLVHLAAVTGKASRKDYYKINFNATKKLIDQCVSKGINNFLFISSVAAGFKKKSGYHYAESKYMAEQYLINSGLRYMILRPTMIFGNGSPVFAGLSSLAKKKVIPVFGNGKNIVSPVHASDVAAAINNVISNNMFSNEVLNFGGVENITLAELLAKISVHTGKKGNIVRIPLLIAVPPIFLADKLLYRFTPVTLGQLATFRNDGTGSPDGDALIEREGSPSIDRMIRDSLDHERFEVTRLGEERECILFSDYLIDNSPTDYVIIKYRQFLKKIDNDPGSKFDAFILRFANRSKLFTGIADSFSKFFFPGSLLRKRLGYLFAILETSPVIYKKIDEIKPVGKFIFFLKSGYRIGLFSISLLVSIPLLFPAKLILSKKEYKKPEDTIER